MELENILSQLDNLLRSSQEACRPEGLSDLEKKIIRETWKGKSYQEMQIPGYSKNYIKTQVAPKLWNLLTQMTGKKITRNKFKLIMSQLGNDLYIDWGEAPTVDDFYGRSQQLSELEQWTIEKQCKLVAILGISGIGKSALMAKFVENNYTSFQCVIWRSLDMTPSIDDILLDLLQCLLNVKDDSLPKTVDKKISKLLDFLTQHRCLLILDQFEGVMGIAKGSGTYRENCENYGKLLQKIGTERHNSCLLLSTQEPPREVKQLASVRGAVRQLQLKGLSLEEAKELLQDYDLNSTTFAIEELNKSYRGHPLALKMSANIIKNIHNGQVSEFLQGSLYMGDVLMSLLDKQFSYLSDLDKKILKYLANNSEEMNTKIIIKNLSVAENIAGTDIQNALNNLLQRAIIYNSQMGKESIFTLEPIVKKYIKKRLNKRVENKDR